MMPIRHSLLSSDRKWHSSNGLRIFLTDPTYVRPDMKGVNVASILWNISSDGTQNVGSRVLNDPISQLSVGQRSFLTLSGSDNIGQRGMESYNGKICKVTIRTLDVRSFPLLDTTRFRWVSRQEVVILSRMGYPVPRYVYNTVGGSFVQKRLTCKSLTPSLIVNVELPGWQFT